MYRHLPMALAAILLLGCVESQPLSAPKQKSTDKIGEFDPNADAEVVKPAVKITNPITAPLEAYQPMVQQLAALGDRARSQPVQCIRRAVSRFVRRIHDPHHPREQHSPASRCRRD